MIELIDGKGRKIDWNTLGILDKGLVIQALKHDKPDFQGWVKVDVCDFAQAISAREFYPVPPHNGEQP